MSQRSTARGRVATDAPNVAAVYSAAEAAFARDDLTSCAALLAVHASSDRVERARAQLLQAKVSRIEGDRERWLASARMAAADGVPDDVRISGLALWAFAARRGPSDSEATTLFERVHAECERARPADAAYATYIAALDAWQRRDYEEAERLANANIARADGQAESIALLGWIAVKRERLAKSATYFRKALAIVRRSDPLPVRHYGVLVQAVLNAAIETADLAACARMAKEYENVPWTDSSRLTRFAVLGRLRYAALLEGDLHRAWFYGRAEATIFETGPYAASGEISASIVTRALGDEESAELQLRKAWDILREFRWSNAHAEQRIALLDFACAAAMDLPSEARKALMLYASITEKEDPKEAFTRDRRVNATEYWAAGRVSESLGKRAEAIENYRKSLATWRTLGCVMRAADVALDLLRFTRDPVYRETIDALAERAPHAFIVSRAREFEGPLGKLGPVQRGILALILRGEGAKAIAAQLERSPYTVINHTRKIFDAFEVHSRAELRRVCLQANITPESLS